MSPSVEHPADHPRVAAVKEALRRAGADPASIAGLVLLPDAVTTAAAAAAALEVEVGQIANSLVFDADGAPLLVLTSGAHRVDTDRVAALVGAQRVGRASTEFVREATGQVIGGVAPVGHPAPVRTLVDVALGGSTGSGRRAGWPARCSRRRSTSSSPSPAARPPRSPEPYSVPGVIHRRETDGRCGVP